MRGFQELAESENRCTWVDDEGQRCSEGAVARLNPRASMCNTHSYWTIGEGYYDEKGHYHETKPSPYSEIRK